MHTIVCQVLEQVKQVILWVLISSFYSPLLKSFGWGLARGVSFIYILCVINLPLAS